MATKKKKKKKPGTAVKVSKYTVDPHTRGKPKKKKKKK